MANPVHSHAELIERSDEILGGVPVFRGTRVPVRTLFDYLQAGQSLGEFLEDFPSLHAGHAVNVLELAATLVLEPKRSDDDPVPTSNH
jgi:uncharacterized protein (DUF433 family)